MKKIATILFFALAAFNCFDIKDTQETNEEVLELRAQLDSLQKMAPQYPKDIKGQVITFLTFQKEDAEQAMNFYIGLFDNSKIMDLKRWDKEGPGKEGTLMQATFSLNGKLFMCSDSPAIHNWDFTPAVSNYVACSDANQLEHLFTKLSENGKVLMPLDNYGFSKKFGFVEDRFGVSWQLNLR